jgi:monoamine oxidase
VIVAGAGLAGLSAARDLMNQGTDVVVLEARNRPGGRVEQTTLADGRIVQLGGEVIGPFHRAYVELVEELGLTIVRSFPQLPGEDTWVLADGRYVGDGFPWMSNAGPPELRGPQRGVREAGGIGGPRRPVVAPRGAAARQPLDGRLAA